MNDLDARFAAAVGLHGQGRVGEAELIYRQLLEVLPGHIEVVHLLGVALLDLGRLAEAGPLLHSAVATDPGRADFRLNLSNYLLRSGDQAGALTALRCALAIVPSLAEAWLNTAYIARRARRTDDAITGYRRGLAVTPNDAPALASLGGTLYEGGHGRAAVTAYRRSLALNREPVANSGYLYLLEFDGAATPEIHHRERRRWAHAHLPANNLPAAQLVDPDAERTLSIGFFAPSFDGGAQILLEPFLRKRDPRHFRVVMYSNAPPSSETSHAFKELVDAWRTVGELDDRTFDRVIRDDAIDILVDAANHIGGHRLAVFAGKPAPILVSGWCHGIGTGIKAFDYVVGDPLAIPEDERRFLVEHVIDVPCRTTFAPPSGSPPVSPPPSSQGQPFTFGHFGRLSKVTDETVRLWRRLLAEAPATRLLLKADPSTAASGYRRVIDGFALEIDPARIIVVGPKDRRANMADYAMVDLALDPTPVAGPMTVWESLWMGAPAVTLGGTWGSRQSATLLNAVGLPEFIADSESSYLDLALGLVRDPSPLLALRHTLRDRLAASEAGNQDRIAAAMSQAFRSIWRSSCAR